MSEVELINNSDVAKSYEKIIINAYILAKGYFSIHFDVDFRIDIIEMLDNLVAGTLSYIQKWKLPIDFMERKRIIIEYISEIEGVLSNESLCPEVKRYIYTILSSSYWIINEL